MMQVFTSAERLGKKLLAMLLGCLFAMPLAVIAQPVPTYNSPPQVPVPPATYAPQVNATNFINTGTWNITSTPRPYQTSSTYNYTNSGTMNCSIGWEFDHGPYPSGVRGWSSNFVNKNNGTINAIDGTAAQGLYAYTVSYLLISATNILNQGTLSAGASGLIVLNGSGVNVSRSGIEITPITGTGSSTINNTNFIPDTAIYDEYWRGGTNYLVFSGSPWTGAPQYAVYPFVFYNVGEPCGVNDAAVSIGPLFPQIADSQISTYGPHFLILTNMDLMSTTNVLVYSNIVHQAIFAYSGDANIIPSDAFGPSLSSTNIYLPMVVQLASYSTNLVTGKVQANTIYVDDDLAAVYTNGFLSENLVIYPSALCTDPTFRPDSVVVSRTDSTGDYTLGSAGNNGVPTNTFFYDPLTFSNYVCIGRADAYSALVDNLASEPISGTDISNAPGKIQIYAKDLNLSNARLTAGAELLVQASNLVSSAGAVMDCQNLSYNLGSTNGMLNITNLAGQNVQRLYGTVDEWSGVWTNYQINVYTNWAPDTNMPPKPMAVLLTNVVEIDMAITVVDATGLGTVLPVNVLNLILHSTNMVVSDTMNVGEKLLFDGQNLTINGGLYFTNSLQSWSSATAPTLRNFTNNGVLSIPISGQFFDSGSTNYAAFVNNGTITAGSETINSDYFQSAGSQSDSGEFLATTSVGKVENGSITSGQDIQFTAGSLKLNNSKLAASGQLYFQVTNSLFDAGGSSSNVLTCFDGFDLANKPATGDLLGTQLETTTPVYAAVDHYWSGLDLGANSAGYTNNEAVGQLVLNEGAQSEFNFHATSVSNAIYVDLLDLSQCPDFLNPDVVTIDPNFVIYYAAVKLPSSFVVPPNASGIAQQPEEYLNGQLGGHLRWVSSFAGPNSSVAVLINGKTALVNKALRYSKIIDSNGNGIPNYYDLNPFDPPPVVLSASVAQGNPPPTGPFTISWTAAPSTTYLVQYSTDLSPAVWMPLLSYTNVTSSNLVVTVRDTNAVSGQRFYRVSHP